MDAPVTPHDSGMDAGNGPPSPELDGRDLERLRVAGAGARLAAGVGSVGLALMTLALLDVGFKNPRGLGTWAPQPAPTFVANASAFVASVAAIALFWAFGRNVSAHFAGTDSALARAFRHLRFFFVVWTFATAVSVLTTLVGIWQDL